jgi:hypothetical protein
VEETKSRAESLCQRILSSANAGDWAARAQALLYQVQQGIATFGSQVN